MPDLGAKLILVFALAGLCASAEAQLVPMLGGAAVQSGAALSNPAPGLIQDARQSIGSYNQRSGIPLPGGPGAMPLQPFDQPSGGSSNSNPSPSATPPQPAEPISPPTGYVVNGQVIGQCSSGMACLHQLRRAMGVAP